MFSTCNISSNNSTSVFSLDNSYSPILKEEIDKDGELKGKRIRIIPTTIERELEKRQTKKHVLKKHSKQGIKALTKTTTKTTAKHTTKIKKPSSPTSSFLDLNQFLLDLQVGAEKAQTFKERLNLLKSLGTFENEFYTFPIICSSTLYVTLVEKNNEISVVLLNSNKEPFFTLRKTLDNTLEETLFVEEETLSPEAAALKNAIKDFFDLSEHVITLDLGEWHSLLQSAMCVDFEERRRFLKQNLTFVSNPQAERAKFWWQAWIEMKAPSPAIPGGVYLLMILTEDQYDSNTFLEAEIRDVAVQGGVEANQQQQYLFIKFFDQHDAELRHPLYVHRMDLKGAVAELIYIQSSNFLSGTEVRDKLYFPLEAYFQPTETILCDNSEIDIHLTPTEKKKLKLRQLKGGSSWYESIGYTPFDCRKKMMVSDKCISQSSLHYYAAAEKIQSITLKEIFKIILKGYPSHQKQFKSLVARYLDLSNSQEHTLMSLISKISLISRTHSNSEKKRRASQDLVYLYENLLSPSLLDNLENSLEQKIYNLALSVIHETQVFHKPRGLKMPSFTFAQFQATPHQNFDDLVKDIVNKHQVSLWKDFIPFLS